MLDAIRNAQGERLDFTFHPGAAQAAELVVIGHGVTAHKDRPFLIALAEGLARSGIAALRISFSGNGASEGRFADSNITKEVDDLGAVLDAVLDAFPERRIVYAGHSMGGAVGVLRANRDARIGGLVSLAGIVHTRAFAERTFGALTPGRDLMLDKPGCVLTHAYLDDLRGIDSVLDQAEQIRVPWLFVHGTRDELVPVSDAEDAFARTRAAKRLVLLEGADHRFEPGFTEQMVDTVTSWCRATLCR